MTHQEITTEMGPENALLRLSKDINELHGNIELRLGRVRSEASTCLTDASLAGQALIKAKAMVRGPNWLTWLKVNCPTISRPTAGRYMLIAHNWAKVEKLGPGASIRQALLLCAEEKQESEGQEVQRWPAYLEGVRRFSKVVKYVGDHPLSEWPDEGRDELRTQLAPVAAALWPDRFADAKA